MSTTIGCPIPGASQPKEPVRLIDATPILKNIELDIMMLHGKADELGKSDYAIWCTKEIVKLKDFAKWLKSIPTIDPESLRPTAHWKIREIGYGHKVATCSGCGMNSSENVQTLHEQGANLTVYDPILTKFCPNCGAQMDGGTDNG